MSDFALYAFGILLTVLAFVVMDVIFPYILRNAIDDGTDDS